MKKHSWKISFEKIIDIKFNLFHLNKFECRTYSLDKSISKKNKLRKRAYIKYFLKYNNSNIYFIWIFSQQKVIRTRNIIFDESIYYDSSEINVVKLLKSMIKQLIETLRIQKALEIIEIELKLVSNLKVEIKKLNFQTREKKKLN